MFDIMKRMKIGFFDFKAKKEVILVLDIGTEAVKALILEKKDPKSVILGASLQYFEQFGVFDGLDFEADIIKTAVLEVIKKIQQNTGKKPRKLLLNLPPDIAKARIVFHSFKRENPKENISKAEQSQSYQRAIGESKEIILKQFSQDSGILPQDIHFLPSEILEKRIDGYSVPNLYQYQGKVLDFKILLSFVPIYYWEIFQKKIFPTLDFKDIRILHQSQNLQNFLLKETSDGLFVDAGGEITQLFLVKNGRLENIFEFQGGGKSFSQSIAQTFGLTEEESKLWIERYSENLFSKGARERIKKILILEQRRWLLNLNSALEGMNLLKFSPTCVFLFGGGAILPEIEKALKRGSRDYLFSVFSPQIKFLWPKDLKNIKISSSLSNNLQYTPTLLNYYSI